MDDKPSAQQVQQERQPTTITIGDVVYQQDPASPYNRHDKATVQLTTYSGGMTEVQVHLYDLDDYVREVRDATPSTLSSMYAHHEHKVGGIKFTYFSPRLMAVPA